MLGRKSLLAGGIQRVVGVVNRESVEVLEADTSEARAQE